MKKQKRWAGRYDRYNCINAYLCGLGVLPGYRGPGIGSEITGRLKEHCVSRGLHLQLLCDEGLAPFYEKMGFERFAVGLGWY
ncbi:MAG: GNAT family N-acetyltransferase [Defluviitaleaceae bacterium]|nr:GNAT family N-acetyltransferase [Defluviitaleaceae bacterium]